MAISALRQLFRQIRKLETKNSHLASITRRNLRLRVDQFKLRRQKQLSGTKRRYDSKQSMEDLSSFVKMLSQANYQTQKIKLVEISCNINQYVDDKFKFRSDRMSKEMMLLYSSNQFKKLESQTHKKFVQSILKKVYRGDQSYTYPHLSDFFLDHHFEKSSLTGIKQLKKLDSFTGQLVGKILKGQLKVSPDYKRIYEYYFTQLTSDELVFSNYLNSFYILINFDDTSEAWAANTRQQQNSKQIQQRKNQRTNEERTKMYQEKQHFKRKVEEQLEDEQLKLKIKQKLQNKSKFNHSRTPKKKY